VSILVSVHQLSKAFGVRPLFTGLTFSIESGDRIGLIGPNGAGKSTLLRILASEEGLDSGTLSFQKGLKVGFLKQVPEFKEGATLLSTVMEGVHSGGNSSSSADPMENWEEMAIAQECLAKLSLVGSNAPGAYDESTLVESLSGGWRKRVALARELARQPDLLLLDEPTNHLDLESILWLEKFLAQSRIATLTITHDRAFLQKVANRIIELDRRNPEGLLNIRGSYADYLETKNLTLEAQKQRETVLKNTLRRETEWLRRGAKARTTKQQARIDRAEDLKQEVSDVQSRNMNRAVRFEFQGSDKNPKKLMEVKKVGKSYPGKKLFGDLDMIVTPGSRIGILGKNGAGKSSLIRILLGEEEPDEGEVFRSDSLKVSYFEQNRETLDPDLSVIKTLCPTGDSVIYQGRSVHIRSYLDRFLFEPGQMEMAVGKLSGGEQSRLLIARLMLNESNLLVLDEPTNDLDFATLNLLEECLSEFQGAIIIVTHDRFFLDQVTDQILAFSGDEKHPTLVRFADLGQWEQWLSDKQIAEDAEIKRAATQAKAAAATASGTQFAKKKKLSFKDQRELDMMEQTILEAETELAKWTEESTKSEHASNSKKLAEIAKSMSDAQQKVNSLYERWTQLTTMQGG
jgi:ATP-binding cassette subfamily F protein uup